MSSKRRSHKSKKKQRKRKKKVSRPQRKPVDDAPIVLLEYYTRAFLLLHRELSRSGYDSEASHPIRQRFWQFIRPGKYDLIEARELLQKYFVSLEHQIAEIVRDSSLAYWFHLYRRLSPGPIGQDKQPGTIGLTRAVLEAAIQKYAKMEPCPRIGESKKVPLEEVLGGILAGPGFEEERALLKKANQLVLTNFTHLDMIEFYDLEKLAYEIWRTGATLRTIGKGAPLIVEDSDESFHDDRSDELGMLLENYDGRRREPHTTAIGAVFEDVETTKVPGTIFLPIYNLVGLESKAFDRLFKNVFKTNLIGNFKFNFIWIPFNLRSFREVHLPLAEAFRTEHGVSLDAVLAIISSLLSGVFHVWMMGRDQMTFCRYWQRAYEGPRLKREFRKIIKNFIPAGLKTLGIQDREISSEEFEAAINFWELKPSKRQDIDLAYSGPHYIFLPISHDQWFVDYTWILRRLFDLFFDVYVEDQNFKGDALEKAVGRDSSVLPLGKCRALDGTEKEIDCAIPIGEHLVILECKAVARSIAYDRGDPKAINYRIENVVERALSEVDEKAAWLANRPKGTNYDVTSYKDVLPIAISPFVEFIPSLESRYWITEGVPRVLIPSELAEVLEDTQIIDKAMNKVVLQTAS